MIQALCETVTMGRPRAAYLFTFSPSSTGRLSNRDLWRATGMAASGFSRARHRNYDHAVTLSISESRLKSRESKWYPAESVICTCQPKRSNRRALSTAAIGVMRIVTTLCPFFEAWIAYVMASSQDTNIHGVRRRRDGAFHYVALRLWERTNQRPSEDGRSGPI